MALPRHVGEKRDAFACECGRSLFLHVDHWSKLRPGSVMVMEEEEDAPTLHLQCAACRTIYALVKGQFVVVWKTP